MPDITMCENKKCKVRLNCYRYTAKPSALLQSYSKFKAKDCEYYWPIRERKL